MVPFDASATALGYKVPALVMRSCIHLIEPALSHFYSPSLKKQVDCTDHRPLRKPPLRKPPLRKPPLRKPPLRKPPLRKPPLRKPPLRKPAVLALVWPASPLRKHVVPLGVCARITRS